MSTVLGNNNKLLWSEISSWTKSQKPQQNSNVIIGYDSWVVLDVNPPRLNNLIINGKLSIFESAANPSLNISLIASYIRVNGELEIINENAHGSSTTQLMLADRRQQSENLEDLTFPIKTIDVFGRFKASGIDVVASYFPLLKTVHIGDMFATLNSTSAITWKVGDTIVFSPTAFYDKLGAVWYGSHHIGELTIPMVSAVETRTITDIRVGSDNVIFFDKPLQYDHLCETSYNETFCGYVGVVSRSVNILTASDTSQMNSAAYGRGGVINVYTNIEVHRNALIHFSNVHFQNMGDALSDTGAIFFTDFQTNKLVTFLDETSNFTASDNNARLSKTSVITQSSFTNTFDTSVYCDSSIHESSNSIQIKNNLFVNVWTGAVGIKEKCEFFEVTDNLVAGHYFPDSKFIQGSSNRSSSVTGRHPIAAFVIFADEGVFTGNIVSGSKDTAFAIGQVYFLQNAVLLGFPYMCDLTYSKGINRVSLSRMDEASSTLGDHSLITNEAVAASIGLMIVTVTSNDLEHMETPAEAYTANSCGVVNNFKLWRNDHAGILAIDLATQIVVYDTVLAENTIGLSFNVYMPNRYDFFLGLLMSKVLGIVGNEIASNRTFCETLPDTLWPVTYDDPTVNVLAGTGYHRVGVMMPQLANAPQTCAYSSSSTCRLPYAITNACMLPLEKRYGLPVSLQYSEMHIHGNTFAGFCRRPVNNIIYKSVAISLNPSQVDRFSLPILEKNTFMFTNSFTLDERGFSQLQSGIGGAPDLSGGGLSGGGGGVGGGGPNFGGGGSDPYYGASLDGGSNSSTGATPPAVMTGFDIFSFRDVIASSVQEELCSNTTDLCLKRSSQAVMIDLDGSTLSPFLSYISPPNSFLNFSSCIDEGGSIIFYDEIALNVPSRSCFTVTNNEIESEKFAYCSNDEEAFMLGSDLNVGTLQINTNVPTAEIPFTPFTLYSANWDDRNPTIYPFFQLFANPDDTKLEPYNQVNTSGSKTHFQSRDAYDFYANGVTHDITSMSGHVLDNRFTYTYRFISFSPEYEECSDKILFNRNKLVFADGYYHYMHLLGQTPYEWVIRWNAPVENNTAVVSIVFDNDDRHPYNVFVGNYPLTFDTDQEDADYYGKCRYVASLRNPVLDIIDQPEAVESTQRARQLDASHTVVERHIDVDDSSTEPKIGDKAGTNCREAVMNLLTLTMRGGAINRYYTIKRVPMLILNITTTVPVTWDTAVRGKSVLAELLQIQIDKRIMITRTLNLTVHSNTSTSTYTSNHRNHSGCGSVVEYSIVPSQQFYVARTLEGVQRQVAELEKVYSKMSTLFTDTKIFENQWKVPVYEAVATVPVTPRYINEADVDQRRLVDPLLNIEELRRNLTIHNAGTRTVLTQLAVSGNLGDFQPTVSPVHSGDDHERHGESHHDSISSLNSQIAIIVSTIGFVLLLALLFILTTLYYRRKYHKGLMSTVTTQHTGIDVFQLMSLFHVNQPTELICVYKSHIDHLLDVVFVQSDLSLVTSSKLFPTSMSSSSSSLLPHTQTKGAVDSIREMIFIFKILIRKSVVLGSVEIKSLIEALETKSKHTLLLVQQQLLSLEESNSNRKLGGGSKHSGIVSNSSHHGSDIAGCGGVFSNFQRSSSHSSVCALNPTGAAEQPTDSLSLSPHSLNDSWRNQPTGPVSVPVSVSESTESSPSPRPVVNASTTASIVAPHASTGTSTHAASINIDADVETIDFVTQCVPIAKRIISVIYLHFKSLLSKCKESNGSINSSRRRSIINRLPAFRLAGSSTNEELPPTSSPPSPRAETTAAAAVTPMIPVTPQRQQLQSSPRELSPSSLQSTPRQQHQPQNSSNNEVIEILICLKSVHATLSTMFQQNKMLTMAQIYQLTSFEQDVYNKVIKKYVASPLYAHIYDDRKASAVAVINIPDDSSSQMPTSSGVSLIYGGKEAQNQGDKHSVADIENGFEDEIMLHSSVNMSTSTSLRRASGVHSFQIGTPSPARLLAYLPQSPSFTLDLDTARTMATYSGDYDDKEHTNNDVKRTLFRHTPSPVVLMSASTTVTSSESSSTSTQQRPISLVQALAAAHAHEGSEEGTSGSSRSVDPTAEASVCASPALVFSLRPVPTVMFSVPVAMRPPPLAIQSVREVELNREVPYDANLWQPVSSLASRMKIADLLKPPALSFVPPRSSSGGGTVVDNTGASITNDIVVSSSSFQPFSSQQYQARIVLDKKEDQSEDDEVESCCHQSDVSSTPSSRRSGQQSSEAEDEARHDFNLNHLFKYK